MRREMKVMVELTIEITDDVVVDTVKRDIEAAFVGFKPLADVCWDIGNFLDTEVVEIKFTETHDTR